MPRKPTPGRTRGFVLVTAAVSIVALLGLVGLAIDIGRLMLAHGELQVFADEAAIAAVFELDGTSAGLTRARDVALAGPGSQSSRNRWNFAADAVPSVQPEFAATPDGAFDSNPGSAAALRFVRVHAGTDVKLYFLAAVPGIPGSKAVAAVATAGQNPRDSLGDGLAPFSPTAHDPGAQDFGFVKGQIYTLRWAPSGQRNKPGGSCAGDVGFDPGGSSDRGYVDVGQGSGASSLKASVVDNSFFLPSPIGIGSTLTMLSGQESVPSAMEQRFSQDTDVTAATFSDYRGNGRRLLVTSVNTGNPPVVVGFASFFLRPTPCGTQNTTPCCAEYVGGAVVAGAHGGAGGPGLYVVQLIL